MVFRSDVNWLVVSTPLKNISQLGWLFPIYAKIKNVPNHQPVNVYQKVSPRGNPVWSFYQSTVWIDVKSGWSNPRIYDPQFFSTSETLDELYPKQHLRIDIWIQSINRSKTSGKKKVWLHMFTGRYSTKNKYSKLLTCIILYPHWSLPSIMRKPDLVDPCGLFAVGIGCSYNEEILIPLQQLGLSRNDCHVVGKL